MSDDRPLGRRYSHVYLEPGDPVYESRRLQARVGAYAKANFRDESEKIVSQLNIELGADLSGNYPIVLLPRYLSGVRTADFLEAVTIVSGTLKEIDRAQSYGRTRVNNWVTFLTRAMAEENSKFEIDADGGIHPRVDAVFASDRLAALRRLGAARYFTAREHFETAHAALDERPSSTNRAIREIYMANEELFKLVCPGATNLDPGEINKRLVPVVAALVQGPEKDALNGMLRAASDYATASHQYRHAQGQPELAPASMETATFMIGTGTALLRWLVWVDGERQDVAAPVLSV